MRAPNRPADFGVSDLAYRVSESDDYFRRQLAKAGVNEWAHQDDFSRVATQQVIRENQDVLYSSAVVDISQGATISVPDYPGYSIIQVLDLQNYTVTVLGRGQSVHLTAGDLSFGSHVYLNARTQPTSITDDGFADAHRQQRSLVIDAGAATPYSTPAEVLPAELTLRIRTALVADVDSGMVDDFTKVAGTPAEVDLQGHLYATAYGWGGLPVANAAYLSLIVEPGAGAGSSVTVDVPPLDFSQGGFWPVTTYNVEGWIAFDRAAVCHRDATPNADGTYTIRFNQPGEVNNLEVVDDFAAMLRMYVPTSTDLIRSYLAAAPSKYVVAH